MTRLLFICAGNTCRSPMAAAQARMIATEMASTVAVASAGLSAAGGEEATSHAQLVTMQNAGALTEHRSVQLDDGLLAAADLVLTMTARQRDAVSRRWPAYSGRVMTLGEAAGLDVDVEDPFGGSVEDYKRTSQQLIGLLRAAWPTIGDARR